jgi:hypothetical protein
MSNSSELTTNACESFHSKFNSCFYTPHPEIASFRILEKKKIQINIKIVVQTFNNMSKKLNQ